MVKAAFTAKKLPKSPDLGVFLSLKPFLPLLIVLKLTAKPFLQGGFCPLSS